VTDECACASAYSRTDGCADGGIAGYLAYHGTQSSAAASTDGGSLSGIAHVTSCHYHSGTEAGCDYFQAFHCLFLKINVLLYILISGCKVT
jgi:hypothetical protein